MIKCDLHLHSTKSDGALSPTELVDMAHASGLDCISVTDHDTAAGVPEAVERGAQVGVRVLPGIEISSFEDIEIHILLYNFDYKNPALIRRIAALAENRRVRNYEITAKLKNHGVTVDLDKIYRDNDGKKTIGRPDIADDMIRQGIFHTRYEAFDEYLGVDKKAYVRSARITPKEALSFARDFGGVSVLAHPKNLKLPQAALEAFVVRLKELGLMGIEADYFSHTTAERIFYRSLADKYKLICTGGSDYHERQYAPGEKFFRPGRQTRQSLDL